MADPGLASKFVEMQQDDYALQAWGIPRTYPPQDAAYVSSLRMDLSRVNRDLERATHPNHRTVLKRAQKFLQGLFEKATRRG